MPWGPIRFPDFSISQYAQPKQRFSFVVLYKLPQGMSEVEETGAIGQGIRGQLTREQYPSSSIITTPNTSSASDLLTISTKDFPEISWQIKPDVDNHFYNSSIGFASKRQFLTSIPINFREYVTSPITRILHNWQKLANDSVTNNIGYQDNYKGLIIKLEIDPNVFHQDAEMLNIGQLMKNIKSKTKDSFSNLTKVVTRQIIFDGIWPQTINEPGNSYDDTGTLQTVSVSFNCDRYFEDLDWSRYIGGGTGYTTADILSQQYIPATANSSSSGGTGLESENPFWEFAEDK